MWKLIVMLMMSINMVLAGEIVYRDLDLEEVRVLKAGRASSYVKLLLVDKKNGKFLVTYRGFYQEVQFPVKDKYKLVYTINKALWSKDLICLKELSVKDKKIIFVKNTVKSCYKVEIL